ncbi:MAG: carboxylating nicotinate-nucleotide diphosphorylase [Oscillospiraceae bacterium]|jgi:nicotinate-nucleotide pyrophosphorylase (carboxylating)|nr:carboxylating nicotinate-nucleotide diphosphorylase [Oscillospiraceae bacterium]
MDFGISLIENKELDHPGLNDFLRTVLDEDVGTGDITTLSCVPQSAVSHGAFIAKEPGVISGLGVMKQVFELLDADVCVTLQVRDGDTVSVGDVIAKVSGPSRAILTGERTALNLLQHMSGVATQTAEAVAQVRGTKTIILDTRKTTPGFRALDKYAVRCGGGANHRFNLTDGVLIKDNHIKASGGIKNAVAQVRRNVSSLTQQSLTKLWIEVETETLEQVQEALDAGADIIMLDNMSVEMMTNAVSIINGRALTEASGNMGERDIMEIAKTGVDFISIGSLTHSVKALDISLKFD